jgi:hypothetical protein
MRKQILILCLSLGISASLFASAITPEMRSNANTALSNCKASYGKVIDSKTRIAQIKGPSPQFNNLAWSLGAFAIQFAEFRRFFDNESEKINKATTAEALRDLVAAYTSNCSRFSSGLLGFADWAITGKGPSGFDKIYEGWQNEAKCGKIKCP